MQKQNKLVIWPTYFDSTRTRSDGRRVPRGLAVSSPKVSELKEAVEKLRLDCELVSDAGHPKTPWMKTGMLLVKKSKTKSLTIKKIGEQLIKIRSSSVKKV